MEVDDARQDHGLPSAAGKGSPSAPAVASTGRQDRIGASAYRALYLQCPDGVLFTVPDGRILAANPAACEILRMSEEEICRRGRPGLADPSDERWAALLAERERTGTARGVARMLRGDGTAIETELSARLFIEESELRTCTVIRDVTARIALERRLTEMAEELRDRAFLDELTGLRNRRGFVEVATQVLEVAERQLVPCHLLFLDVDNMKMINDVFGHAAGDRALKAVASTLGHVLRRSDVLARLGGDEFVALTVGLDDSRLGWLERRIRAELLNATDSRDAGAAVEVSLGWAAYVPGSAWTLEDLLVEADRDMYADKERRRSGDSAPAPELAPGETAGSPEHPAR